MKAILRRLVLAGCCLIAAWYFWYTPATILGARVLDLEEEYQSQVARRYVTPQQNSAKSSGSSFVRRHSNPGSPQRYRENVLTSRPLPAGFSLPASWVDGIRDAAIDRGPFVDRHHQNLVYFSTEELGLDSLGEAMRKSLKTTGYVNAYTTAGAEDLEIILFPEPRSSDAPSGVMYPRRGLTFPWAIGGFVLYTLLGWQTRKRGQPSIHFDPVPLAVLDLAAAGGMAFLVALPLRLAPSTKAATDDPLGGLVWFGALAVLPLLGLWMLALRESFGLEVLPHALRIRRMFRARTIPFTDMQSAAPEPADNMQSTITLQLQSGERIQLPWAGMQGALFLVDALQQHGLLRRVQTTDF